MKNLQSRKVIGLMLTILILMAFTALIPSPALTLTSTSISSLIRVVTPNATQATSPLSKVDLEPILIMPSDLPSGYSGAQVRNHAPEMFSDAPKAENEIYQQFQKGGETVGGVTVLLYESSEDIDRAYSIIVDGFGQSRNESGIKSKVRTLSDIGDKAVAVMTEVNIKELGLSSKHADLVFVRCHAVVHIRFSDIFDMDISITSYANRLSKRLITLVCR